MPSSISFDRAADIYDQTRGLPDGIGPRIARSLNQFLDTSDRILEIGIGTGRIAAHLVEAGRNLTGIDISPRMLEKLRQNLAGYKNSPTVLLADAARTPFERNSFDAVLAVHVLHLIPDWESVLQEAQRILTDGGNLITGYNWRPADDPVSRLRKHHKLFLKSKGITRDFLNTYQDVETWLTGSGAVLQEVTAAEWNETCTIESEIKLLVERAWSETWDIPDEIYQQSIEVLVRWAQETFKELDQPLVVKRKFIWQRYQW